MFLILAVVLVVLWVMGAFVFRRWAVWSISCWPGLCGLRRDHPEGSDRNRRRPGTGHCRSVPRAVPPRGGFRAPRRWRVPSARGRRAQPRL